MEVNELAAQNVPAIRLLTHVLAQLAPLSLSLSLCHQSCTLSHSHSHAFDLALALTFPSEAADDRINSFSMSSFLPRRSLYTVPVATYYPCTATAQHNTTKQ